MFKYINAGKLLIKKHCKTFSSYPFVRLGIFKTLGANLLCE